MKWGGGMKGVKEMKGMNGGGEVRRKESGYIF